MEPHLIHLRPTTELDSDFCYKVKKDALGDYVAQVWGWDEEFQRNFHRRDFELARPDVVIYQSADIGTFEVIEHSDHLHIGEFYILPLFQRRGIGAILLERVLQDATNKCLPVRLEVLKVNPAQSFYKRHGFIISGQKEHHFLMERAFSSKAKTNI